jgi:hypothetical protein
MSGTNRDGGKLSREGTARSPRAAESAAAASAQPQQYRFLLGDSTQQQPPQQGDRRPRRHRGERRSTARAAATTSHPNAAAAGASSRRRANDSGTTNALSFASSAGSITAGGLSAVSTSDSPRATFSEDQQRHYESSLYGSHSTGTSRSQSQDDDDDYTSCSGSDSDSGMSSGTGSSRSRSGSSSVASSSAVSSSYRGGGEATTVTSAYTHASASSFGSPGTNTILNELEAATSTYRDDDDDEEEDDDEETGAATAERGYECDDDDYDGSALSRPTSSSAATMGLLAPPSLAANSTLLSTESFRNQQGGSSTATAAAASSNFFIHRPSSLSPNAFNYPPPHQAAGGSNLVSPVSSTAMTQKMLKIGEGGGPRNRGAQLRQSSDDGLAWPRATRPDDVTVPDLKDEVAAHNPAAPSPVVSPKAESQPLAASSHLAENIKNKDGEDDDDNLTDTTQPTSPGKTAKLLMAAAARGNVETGDEFAAAAAEEVASPASSPPSLTFDTSRLKDRKDVMAPSLNSEKALMTEKALKTPVSSPQQQLQQNLVSSISNASSSSPSRANRIPGGAAAKLLLVGSNLSSSAKDAVPYATSMDGASVGVSPSVGDDGRSHRSEAESAAPAFQLRVSTTHESDDTTFEASLREIEMTLQLAKQEFEMGSPTNRRYHSAASSPNKVMWSDDGPGGDNEAGDDEDGEDAPGDASSYTPSFLNRDHVFFASASAAISALLTPRSAADLSRVGTTAAAPMEAPATPSHGSNSACGSAMHGSAGRETLEGGAVLPAASSTASAGSSGSAFQTPASSSVKAQDPSLVSFGRSDVSAQLLTERTEKKIETLQKRMHDPNKTLTDLLTSIATPESKDAIDMGFMVRRKNACGALKVMTNDPKKRTKICWTVGVLPALTSVLGEGSDLDMAVSVFASDKRIREEYDAARNRAIATLLNLSIPKTNRIPVFHTPGLVQALLSTIMDDHGEARRGCTAILAYLARTPENRLVMVQIPGFSDGVVAVLKPLDAATISENKSAASKKDNKAPSKYPWAAESDSESEAPSRSSKRKGKGGASKDEDSDRTPLITPSKSPSSAVGGSGTATFDTHGGSKMNGPTTYDDGADEMLRASRHHVFAVLSHVIKEKDNAYHLARDSNLLQTLIAVASFPHHHHQEEDTVEDSTSGTGVSANCHALSIQFVANLTRHRLNTKLLVFQERRVVPVLVSAANSSSDAARLHACYGLQNLAQDRACRQELASVDGLVSTLCARGRYARDEKERLSAISALKNLTDEPANLIPLTNTPACIATLMHLAHGKEEGVTELMQYRACDALATLSHWLRKIATSGQALNNNHSSGPAVDPSQQHQASAAAKSVGSLGEPPALFVPSLRVVTWNQWE